jgi:hypothetical protein
MAGSVAPLVGNHPLLFIVELERLVPPALRATIAHVSVKEQGTITDRTV